MAVKKATSATRRGVGVKKAAAAQAATAGGTGTKSAASRRAAAKTPAKKTAAPRGGAGKAVTMTAAKRTAARKATATKSAATRTGGPKTAAGKSAAAKTSATKTAVRKTAVRKTAVRKAAVTRTPATKTTAGNSPPAKAAAPRSSPGMATAQPKAASPASARQQRMRVRENERPWTAKELAEVRADLEADVVRLKKEISVAEVDLAGLMRDAGEGAGDDQADAGTATFEREQEISLANNAREVFEQSTRALGRLIDGSYGICESCGNPIGKNRLLAFPRATLCMTCKSKQERR